MNKLGIYIHIPFCVKKCDYCDFLSAPAGRDMQEKYIKSLIKEIELSKYRMTEYLVDTVFIGGGTPSILEGKWIAEILDTLHNNCNMSQSAEITIECNPGTVTEDKLLTYKRAGVNRISFGLQSANNDELKSIGRIHTYEDFLQSYNIARECGYKNINVDLMSALPGQTEDSYRETLKKIIELNPEHISAYSLIVEEGTKMWKRVAEADEKGKSILPTEEAERNMYYMTKDMLEKAGYIRYEISNYSKIGYECKHNIGYWKRKEYLGFGIGAASLYKEERYSNISDINIYIEDIEKLKVEFGIIDSKENDNIDMLKKIFNIKSEKSIDIIQRNQQVLSIGAQMEEFMFLGLRMMEGISIKTFEEQFGKSFFDVYGKVFEELSKKELLKQIEDYISLTEKGIDISNYVMSEFLF